MYLRSFHLENYSVKNDETSPPNHLKFCNREFLSYAFKELEFFYAGSINSNARIIIGMASEIEDLQSKVDSYFTENSIRLGPLYTYNNCYTYIKFYKLLGLKDNSHICNKIEDDLVELLNSSNFRRKGTPDINLWSWNKSLGRMEQGEIFEENSYSLQQLLETESWKLGIRFLKRLDEDKRKEFLESHTQISDYFHETTFLLFLLKKFPIEWRNYCILKYPQNEGYYKVFIKNLNIHPLALGKEVSLTGDEVKAIKKRIFLILLIRNKNTPSNYIRKSFLPEDIFLTVLEFVLEVDKGVFMDKNSWRL
jgi:hypothetical protein